MGYWRYHNSCHQVGRRQRRARPACYFVLRMNREHTASNETVQYRPEAMPLFADLNMCCIRAECFAGIDRHSSVLTLPLCHSCTLT